MGLETFVAMLINGLVYGGVWALIALGLTLLFSIMNVIFFAHGGMYMIGAFSVYYLCVKFGLNYFFAMIIAILGVAVLGVMSERFLFRPIRGREMSIFFVAIALNWFLESSGYVVFGVRGHSVGPILAGGIVIFGSHISWQMLVVIGGAAISLLALHLFLTHTRQGTAWRAFVEDPEAAQLQGISGDFVSALVFGVSCGLAALAGGLIAPLYYVSASMGTMVVFSALLAVGIGGLGSIPGALIAALGLGLVHSFVGTFMGSAFTWMIIFFCAGIFLAIRPKGIMGVER